jgi:hypothetical protein
MLIRIKTPIIMTKKKLSPYLLRVLLFAAGIIAGFQTRAQTQLHAFKLQQVKLLPGVFKDAQLTDKRYILSLDPDRLLAPYLTEAGLKPKRKATATGKIPAWMATSAGIIYRHCL